MSFNPLSIAILGRQPELGIAELESLYGDAHILPFGDQACLLDIETSQIDFKRLGGSVRVAKLVTTLPHSWTDIENYLISSTPERAASIDGKLSFGISVYGVNVTPRKIAKTALLLKKAIKSSGQSVRMVPHDKSDLSAATVLYNKLTAKNGWELLVVSDGVTTYLAQTTNIQDIDAYAARDQARPKRDAKVGMLPPKLAQIIVNLAVGKVDRPEKEESRLEMTAVEPSSIPYPQSPILILDPFCGTGVTLQEAMLMDYDIYGTDIEPRMIEYTIENLKWLDSKFPDVGDYRRIEIGDATTHKWDFSKTDSTVVVAGETFLGQPLTSLPAGEHLSKIIYEANLINHKFILNIFKQLPAKTRLCLAVPTWRGKHEFVHLPMLDHLTEMGYTVVRFKHVGNKDLIYHRENQVVGRELLVLEKR